MSKETKGNHPAPTEDSLSQGMKYRTRKARMGAVKLEEYDENGEYVRLIAEFFYDGHARRVCDWMNAENLALDAAQQVIEDHSEALEKLDDNEYWKHKKKDCVVWQEGGTGCPDCVDLPWYGECAHCFGGYTDQECTCKPTVSKMEKVAICDACARETNEYETITTSTLAGVIMCSGSMKESCKSNLLVSIDKQSANKKKKERTFYCCPNDLAHDPDFRLFRDLDKAKESLTCWEECGIVKVRVEMCLMIEPGDILTEPCEVEE